jgi:transposase-like protein
MKKKRKARNPKGKTAPPFPKEFKLRVVQLYLEEGYRASLLSQEFKVSEYSIYRWSRLYRQYGEKGLEPGVRKPAKRKQSKSVKKKIVAIRNENPSHGSRRISDILKRPDRGQSIECTQDPLGRRAVKKDSKQTQEEPIQTSIF